MHDWDLLGTLFWTLVHFIDLSCLIFAVHTDTRLLQKTHHYSRNWCLNTLTLDQQKLSSPARNPGHGGATPARFNVYNEFS